MRKTFSALGCLTLALFLVGCQTDAGHRDHGGTGGGFLESPNDTTSGQGSSDDYPAGDYRNTLSEPGF